MEDIRINFRDLGYYAVYLNIALGVLFGSLPLIVGLLLKRRKLAWIALILTVIGGGLLGIFLSYPLAVIFLWLIVRRRDASGTTAAVETSAETPDAE